MSLHHEPAPGNEPRKTRRKTIAELIRQRYSVNGQLVDRDLVVALADHEDALLRSRPFLAGWTRQESALPGILIFTPPDVSTPAVVPAKGAYHARVGLN